MLVALLKPNCLQDEPLVLKVIGRQVLLVLPMGVISGLC